MRSTLLLTSERPPSLNDVKAALLTYDKVHLLDPDDRDLFPATGFPMALGMPPMISLPTSNPVRRIGKIQSFDDDFSLVVEESRSAIRQGVISVIRTYEPPAPELRIGMVDVGGFPLQLDALLLLFRAAAADMDLQSAAVVGDKWLFGVPDRIFQIAEERGNADGTINDLPPLPDLTIPLSLEEYRAPLSNIARARIGHVLKLAGYCMTKGLVPHGVHPSHDSILRKLVSNGAHFVDLAAEVDPYWNYRNRALKLAHDEYLDYDRLDQMTIDDVLKLRTVAWGRQAEARDALFEATAGLARGLSGEADFDRLVSEQIRDYRQKAAEVEDERSQLGFKVKCEIGKVLLSTAGASTAAGTIAVLGTALGAAAALFGGAYFALQQFQDLKPASDQLRHLDEEFKSDARYGIHNFYSQFP